MKLCQTQVLDLEREGKKLNVCEIRIYICEQWELERASGWKAEEERVTWPVKTQNVKGNSEKPQNRKELYADESKVSIIKIAPEKVKYCCEFVQQ